ncbi:hypothetical protein [Bradymonas sediminis]|uniref:hypothetical protein n=1 Tax=Bradymonas sediminis TaxID=1548548 RepID=UPI0010D40740|nr:hypothetical protein [Bradymonas sediminis]TDP73933.1 hypothetical protein DFR33_105267 [Bradymonas sediminis]
MPTVSRLFLKCGLIYFVAAMASGVAMGWLGPAWGAVLLPTYIHLFVVGWITQIIIGVALWLFPKWSKEQPRGREWLSWLALVTLNLGLLLRLGTESMHGLNRLDPASQKWLAWGLVASALLQWVGGMAFMINIWGRIKPKKVRKPRVKKSAPKDGKKKVAAKQDGGRP